MGGQSVPRIIHFEINAKDIQRAVDFYGHVFGWSIQEMEGPHDYWLVTTGDDDQPGINGAITSGGQAPTVNIIDVASVDDFAEKIKAHGGKVVTHKESIPGVGYFHYCEDREGNPFGILESDSSLA